MDHKKALLLLLSISMLLLLFFHSATSQSFIGVNYGEVADDLPPPQQTASLLESTTIIKLRLYGVDPPLIRSLAGTGISVVIGAANADIPSLASNPSAAPRWVAANVLPFHPDTAISTVSIGNEVLLSADAGLPPLLLPAMRNLQQALAAQGLSGEVKVSTVHPMSILSQSEPPSSGRFNPAHVDTLTGILGFLRETGSPFMINPYPYFAYGSDPTPETLAFCLFQPNPGRLDATTGIRYTNMFDAQVDAVRSAIDALGFKEVEIVVAETGWPYKGDNDEAGASLENAKAYNGNLVAHLRSMAGTPLMPGKPIDTYIFALYDEDQKPGPTSERAFGLYHPDLTMVYDIGLSKTSLTSPSSTKKPREGTWCVPRDGATVAQLQANLDYACGQLRVDCRPIQPGGECYLPNTVVSHATYAMNMLYQVSGKQPWDCDFDRSASLSSENPSYGACSYPGR